jgi:hypothetical protein
MKRPAFLECAKIRRARESAAPRKHSGHRAVNLVIVITIALLLLSIFVHGTWPEASTAICVLIIAGGGYLFFDLHQHKKKLKRMKFESWLNAVKERDIGSDIDFERPMLPGPNRPRSLIAQIFLREQFKAGSSPYEAIAAWRHRKAQDRRR